MRHTRRAFTAVILALFLALPALAETVPTPESKAAAGLVRNMMTLVRAEFIDEIADSRLTNGALEGLEGALKEKGIAYRDLTPVADQTDRNQALEHFESQFHPLVAEHPELLEDNWLAYEAIKGMLKGLEDEYTVFLAPDEYTRLKEAMSGGNFGGLGIYIELDKNNENWLTVVEPIEDTPATEAGLQARDVVIKIDGASTRDITIEQAQGKLRGPIGSPVVLTIRRVNQAEPFDVTVVRDKIHVNSVNHKLIEEDGRKIGYVRLRMFGEKTNEELESALRDLERQGAEGFIMDLRNNGGGYIVAAVDVCSKFLPTGSQVVSVKERGAGTTAYRSRPNLRGNDKPLVLLVNEFSASASEITAAALKELDRGVLVGVKTFGKGSVQKIFPLPDGSALKVTTAHYHTPEGHDINKIGVEPDVLVEMEGNLIASDKDEQMNQAVGRIVELLAETRPQAAEPGSSDAIRVSSVEQELKLLNGAEVLQRQVIRRDGRLFEQLTIRRPGAKQTESLLLDISPYVDSR